MKCKQKNAFIILFTNKSAFRTAKALDASTIVRNLRNLSILVYKVRYGLAFFSFGLLARHWLAEPENIDSSCAELDFA